MALHLVQSTYPDQRGNLFKCKSLYISSLSLPALSSAIPPEWEKEFSLECFEDVSYGTDASVVGISIMGCWSPDRRIAKESHNRV